MLFSMFSMCMEISVGLQSFSLSSKSHLRLAWPSIVVRECTGRRDGDKPGGIRMQQVPSLEQKLVLLTCDNGEHPPLRRCIW